MKKAHALVALLALAPVVAPGEEVAEAASSGALAASRCSQSALKVTCARQTLYVTTAPAIQRKVHYQTPLGTPPAGGWPVVFMFQGSLFSSELSFDASRLHPFGAYYQTLTLKKLLDAGYAVVAPEAHLGGNTFWDTNVPPWSVAWSGSPDDRFMLAIFDAIEAGTFGQLDPDRLYATGISSGGYMTSRMAVSYPGRFKALAIQSASYATCSGPLCAVPQTLPADHPPTLFLHGAIDATVPIWTMYPYRDALEDAGHVVSTVVHTTAGHEWIPEAPDAVVAWFDASP
ncbi:extracellular medium-chain-length polyhydroxyalkanoate depolymerase [Chondromyces apiculatus]|uniref:Poly(3-hydroxyoctanoate) depolymerase n=1 Tax=Chondromyces apiculatus DSM 436 TaxID=1192034 RepID=A0A017T4L1_9BACT|nr:prolyl oligopeptidase family serine peptidase [Chondromyces apiculatus]EYF03501.1 Poly(3-hydroxyoctanoate) depolymerase precursor [Chondromyces apiculatus DSM 436]